MNPLECSIIPKAYSYLRFSSPQQAQGDSVRRQMEASRAWAKAHGFELDESLWMSDCGVSAFRGQNIEDGALGLFFREIKAGNVPSGSLLLVESLDRLSRQTLSKALKIFLEVLAAGIKIVTLQDGQIYSQESINSNMGSIMTSLVIMARANEESETKSRRIKAVWGIKRERANEEKLTAMGPAWLELSEDRKSFHVFEERAEVVRKIFHDTLNGLGQRRIARELNDRNEPRWGKKKNKAPRWEANFVKRILYNPAVIGIFQPCKLDGNRRIAEGEPIRDYYPTIVDPEVFHKVQAILATHAHFKGARNEKISNLFTGLAFCSHDGTPCIYQATKSSKSTVTHAYLRSYDSRIKKTGQRILGWRYDDFEMEFLSTVGRLDITSIFADGDTQISKCDRAVARALAELNSVKSRISGYLEAIEDLATQAPPQKAPASIIKRLMNLEDAVPSLEVAHRDAQRNLDDARKAGTDAIQAGIMLGRLIEKRHDPKVREALRRDIRRIVLRIIVHFRVEGEGCDPHMVIIFSNNKSRFSLHLSPDKDIDIKDYVIANN